MVNKSIIIIIQILKFRPYSFILTGDNPCRRLINIIESGITAVGLYIYILYIYIYIYLYVPVTLVMGLGRLPICTPLSPCKETFHSVHSIRPTIEHYVIVFRSFSNDMYIRINVTDRYVCVVKFVNH